MTRPKPLEEMTHYEILNIEPASSQQEIEKAYQVAKSAYGYGALAHYGLVPEEERRLMREKI